VKIKISPTTKIICSSILVGIALASCLNLALRPSYRQGISEERAKALGYNNDEEYMSSLAWKGKIFNRLISVHKSGEGNLYLTDAEIRGAKTMLVSGSEGVRGRVLAALAQLGCTSGRMQPEVKAILHEYVNSPSRIVRSELVRGLRRCPDQDSFTMMKMFTQDPDPQIKMIAQDFVKTYPEKAQAMTNFLLQKNKKSGGVQK
jgi:hypothetical protein